MEAQSLLAILDPIAVILMVGRAAPGPNHPTIITASVTSGRAAGMRTAYLVMMTNPKALLFSGSFLNTFAALFCSVGPFKCAFENFS